MKNKYALLTVDTEALPSRATDDYVKRLMWGEFSLGSAGVRELVTIGTEFNIKHVFFVDFCGVYDRIEEVASVVRWLGKNDQDVQLHAHPEVLPAEFWLTHGYSFYTEYFGNSADIERTAFFLKYFGNVISAITGKPVTSFRAGSFRWNGATIAAMAKSGFLLSFNNSMRAFTNKRSPFALPSNSPYIWSNGIIEVPVSEHFLPAVEGKPEKWVSLTYPESAYFRYADYRGNAIDRLLGRMPDYAVFLLHSWSMLHRDENGHAYYKDDQRLEGYRKLLAKVSKDYDVITTREFLDLHARGKIKTCQTVDIAQAEWPA
ncbi:hypothetical protein [Leeia oryzae]|uniref:hypothetical protein n=1 Tax=Leeia oryzae TaxID=356662 RepID=UPI00039B5473|nr:hypothetical protein [Leeia oryzae]